MIRHILRLSHFLVKRNRHHIRRRKRVLNRIIRNSLMRYPVKRLKPRMLSKIVLSTFNRGNRTRTNCRILKKRRQLEPRYKVSQASRNRRKSLRCWCSNLKKMILIMKTRRSSRMSHPNTLRIRLMLLILISWLVTLSIWVKYRTRQRANKTKMDLTTQGNLVLLIPISRWKKPKNRWSNMRQISDNTFRLNSNSKSISTHLNRR